MLGACKTWICRCAERPRPEFEEAASESAPRRRAVPSMHYSESERSMPIERRIRDKPPQYRHLARQTESVPVLDALRAWLDDTIDKIPSSTVLGKAMGYLHNQWEALVRFCHDGRYGIDTNPVENALRPFVVRRKNWLFCDTRGRSPCERPALLAHRMCQGEWARTLRLPASRVHRTAEGAIPRRRRSPAADPSRPRRSGSRLTPRVYPRPSPITPFAERLRTNTCVNERETRMRRCSIERSPETMMRRRRRRVWTPTKLPHVVREENGQKTSENGCRPFRHLPLLLSPLRLS